MRNAWAGRVERWFQVRQAVGGFYDAALLRPTSPPGPLAFSRLRFISTLDLALSLPGRKVLDVAAGACFIGAGLSQAGRDVTLNDLRPLDDAMRPWEFPPATRVLQANVFDLSPDVLGRFDIVICTELIEHVAHPEDLLRHLRGFLEPGGHIVLTTPNGSFLGNRLPTLSEVTSRTELEKQQFQPDSNGHLFLLTPAELRALLRHEGFEPVMELILGSPSVTGFLKFRHLSFLRMPRLCYLGERIVEHLPAGLKAKLASHLIVAARFAPGGAAG